MPERIRAIQRLWRTKDIKGIKEHQKRVFDTKTETTAQVIVINFKAKK